MLLPYLTSAFPGTGGALRRVPEDFVVDEVPAYAPSGAGDHVFVHVEKRGWTTAAVADALAAALGIAARDIGWAGLKDRHAVTRQWLSLPPPVTPEAARAVALDGVTILDAVRHGHKLRTGHLRGNRFTLRVRDAVPDAAARAEAVLAALAAPPGAPAWYGEQRFGARGDNVAQGLAVLRGERRGGPPKLKRLLISAVQSSLFNAWLRARLDDGLYARVIEGDWLERRGSGGTFSTTAPEVDEARVAAGEVCVTGPMFGPRMRAPAPGTAAAAREAAVLAAAGVDVALFAAAGKLAEGTRRALGVPVADAAVRAVEPGVIEVSFTLPAGAYATAVMREVMKVDGDGPGAAPANAEAADAADADADADAAERAPDDGGEPAT